MSSAIERYLKEDDPLKKTIAAGGKEHRTGVETSAKGADKGNNPASTQAPADAQDTMDNLEKHMREHQEQCQCSRQCEF